MHARDLGGRGGGPKSLILPRLHRLLWVTALEGEVASDLSAFHRIDNMWEMGSRRWAQLVPRLYAYPGAVQMKMKSISAQPQSVSAESEPEQPQGGGGVQDLPPPVDVPAGARVVESTQAALRMSDIGDMFSFSTVPAPSI